MLQPYGSGGGQVISLAQAVDARETLKRRLNWPHWLTGIALLTTIEGEYVIQIAAVYETPGFKDIIERQVQHEARGLEPVKVMVVRDIVAKYYTPTPPKEGEAAVLTDIVSKLTKANHELADQIQEVTDRYIEQQGLLDAMLAASAKADGSLAEQAAKIYADRCTEWKALLDSKEAEVTGLLARIDTLEKAHG